MERRQLLSVTSAVISAPSGSSVAEGNSAALLLTASTDNGDGTWWEVNTGDGTPDQGLYINGPGPTNPTMPESTEFDYTFLGDEGASYTVTAKVYDDNNPCGTPPTDSPYDATPQTIDITDAPITFNANGPFEITEGDGTNTFNLGTISDQGSDPSPDPTYSGTIDWGDGSTSAAIFSGTTVEGVHTYADEGSFTASANVQDDGGSTASGSAGVNVADASIGVSVGDPGATEGKPLNNSIVGTVTDNNPNAPASDLSGTIDWGDGPNGDDGTSTSAATFQAVPGQPGVFNILGSHTYKEEGGYDMVITVNDKGGSSGSSSNMFDVADAAVNLSPTVQINGTEGISTGVLTIATLKDDNPNAPASDFANNVWIDWGDGNADPGTLVSQGNGTFLVQGSNTYAEEGQYTIGVSAYDVGGSAAAPVNSYADIKDAPISLSPNSVGETELLPTGDILAAVLYDSNLANTDATDFSGTATYGDNTAPVNVSFSSIGGGSFLVTVPGHTYNDEKTYTMQVNVQDVGQAPPASCQTTIAVGEGAMALSLGSPIIQGSSDGRQYLVPLTITTHVEPSAAWALAISDAGASEVDVWSTPSPQPGDTPLLGSVAGSIVNSTTWAPGVAVPSTLYVGAYHGSSTIGDIQFFLAEADSGTHGDSVNSQTATAVYFQVQSLGFGGDGQGIVKFDNGTTAYSQTTQWLDGNLNGQIDGTPNLGGTINAGNEHQYPISYVRSTPGAADTMQVTLTVAGTIAVGTRVEGVTDYQGISFSPYQVVAGDINAGNNTTTFTLTADTALPNTIDSSDMNITWEYSVSGSPFYADGQTTNHLYVTGAAAPVVYETELYIGCNAAVGLRPHDPGESDPGATDADQQVTDAIWSQFTGRTVTRVDGTMMQYNHDADTGIYAADMLKQPLGKGQCTAWSDLLVQVLGYQGVTASVLDLASKQIIGNSKFTVKQVPAQGSGRTNYLVGTTQASPFRFHQIVAVNCYPERLYDPSYAYMAQGGVGESAQAVWEDHSLVDVWNGATWNAQTVGAEDLLMDPPNWFIWS